MSNSGVGNPRTIAQYRITAQLAKPVSVESAKAIFSLLPAETDALASYFTEKC